MFSYNSPTGRARELIEPSKDARSLLVSIKKVGKFWILRAFGAKWRYGVGAMM